MKEIFSSDIVYIELSNGKVGYIERETLNDDRFISDLKRNNLTYQLTTANHYCRYMFLTTLSPEQIEQNFRNKSRAERIKNENT